MLSATLNIMHMMHDRNEIILKQKLELKLKEQIELQREFYRKYDQLCKDEPQNNQQRRQQLQASHLSSIEEFENAFKQWLLSFLQQSQHSNTQIWQNLNVLGSPQRDANDHKLPQAQTTTNTNHDHDAVNESNIGAIVKSEPTDNSHPDEADQNNEHVQIYECSRCTHSFVSYSALNAHFTQIHKNESESESANETQTESEEDAETDTDGESEDRAAVSRYVGPKRQVQHKAKRGKSRPNRKRRRFVCSRAGCGRSYQSANGLKVHIESFHERKKNHFCSVCNKGFYGKSSLGLHMMVHTGEKPFACTECGKAFRRKHSLKCHADKVHHGH